MAGQGTYDPATGVGDAPGKNYTGGTCKGAIFDSTGATLTGSFTIHFVVSDNGKRIDDFATAVQDTAGGVGDFSLSFVNIKRP